MAEVMVVLTGVLKVLMEVLKVQLVLTLLVIMKVQQALRVVHTLVLIALVMVGLTVLVQ